MAGASSSSVTRAEFVGLTWEMVNAGHREIGWSDDGKQVVVLNAERLAQHILPVYFKHSQYASWVRAVNAYDFKKTGPGRWQHPAFIRGHPELLPRIRRKPPPARRPGKAAAPATASAITDLTDGGSMAMVRVGKAPLDTAETLAEERQRLWWMQQEMARLEREYKGIEESDFQNRYDTVRLMQAWLTRLRVVPAPLPSPPILINPGLIGPSADAASASMLPLGGGYALLSPRHTH